jgi:hypothetical protein
VISLDLISLNAPPYYPIWPCRSFRRSVTMLHRATMLSLLCKLRPDLAQTIAFLTQSSFAIGRSRDCRSETLARELRKAGILRMARHSCSQTNSRQDTSTRCREFLFLGYVIRLGKISTGNRCNDTAWVGRQDCASVSPPSFLLENPICGVSGLTKSSLIHILM